ncbi:hypothetical protein ACFHW1_25890, partial [Micromonospora sp. LOL_014]|uniref:hypothetical protein n=1 Tax=Micromonospora sp. LOL_014 TaxID=3345415 RepID=UPI003A839A82
NSPNPIENPSSRAPQPTTQQRVPRTRNGDRNVGAISGIDAVQKMKVWPFGVAFREVASNHHMLRWLKTVVVSDVEKAP